MSEHNYIQRSIFGKEPVCCWYAAYVVIVGAIVTALCSWTFQSIPRLGRIPWRGSPADRNFCSCATWLAFRIRSTWRMPACRSIRDGQSSRKSWPLTTFCLTFQDSRYFHADFNVCHVVSYIRNLITNVPPRGFFFSKSCVSLYILYILLRLISLAFFIHLFLWNLIKNV